ncbi:MAG: hypothetical protein JXM73_07690, partial [Anaerolineae bacterium]|nr:hypothetical protein [Anaerolineae bacterium]
MKGYVKWMIAGGVIVGLGIAGYFTHSYWSSLIPSAVAWAQFIAQTQDLGSLILVMILAIVALAELLVALILRQRAAELRREIGTLSDLHHKEIDLLQREVGLLQDEKAEIAAELRVRDEMVRQERSLLLARLRRLQIDAGILPQATVTHLMPALSSRDISGIEQVLSRLEQIELTMDAVHRP